MNGMELARGYFEEYGLPMLRKEFPELLPHLAAGLFGSGSECFGFDDGVSRDHDFEPGFLLLLPGEDVIDRRSAFLLERAYARLPKEYGGVKRSLLQPVGGSRRGVLRTADVFTEKTGSPDGRLSAEMWLRVPEHALAEAVNGELFYDGSGEVTAIRERLRHYPEDIRRKKLAGQLLLMAYTNRAVDEICGMLEDNGIDYLRLGNEYTCDTLYRHRLLDHATEGKHRLDEIRRFIHDQRIIVGTTSTLQSRSYIFRLKHFQTAIVDEASQILEPGLVGLLTQVDKFILIGDHKQLPAVVQQDASQSIVEEPELQAIGLTDCRNSLFERLIRQEQKARRTTHTGILRKQGRMHPDIAEFPNQAFYADEQLEPVPLPHQLGTHLRYDLPSLDALDELLKGHRMVFIPSRFNKRPDLSDKVNADEARIVCTLLQRIRRFYGDRFDPQKTVGVIVPYRNQIAMIRKEAERAGIPGLASISIDTVERYQGSQRDVIIYSFTVQNRYQLDFLTANSFEEAGRIIDRKLNVAITRAREQLIMTGNAEVLSHNLIFRRLMAFVETRGGMADQG